MFQFSLKQLLLGTAIVALTLALAGLIADEFSSPFDDLDFTPAAWANAGRSERSHMAEDLVRNHLTTGLTRLQVKALIGPPAWSNQPNAGYRVLGAETDVYGIDSWSWGGMDDAFVYVHYDANDNVINAEIHGY